MLRNNGAIISTLRTAWKLYRATLKVCFFFAVISAAFAEYFKLYALNSGVGEAMRGYVETGKLPADLLNVRSLAFLGLLSMLVTMCVYGFLVCIGGMRVKEELKGPKLMKEAFALFKKRFPLFLLVCALNGFLWFIASFLSIFGLWLVTSFTLILLPSVLLGNVGVWMSFRENFRLLGSNLLYALQLGFIVVLLLLLKYIVHVPFLAISGDGIDVGLEHVLIIFADAFTLPFIIMIMVVAFYELNAQDDMPINVNEE